MTVIRWVQLGFVAAAVAAGVVVASADGSGAGSGGGAGSGSAAHRPAFDACAKSKLNDACNFTSSRGRDIKGTCQTPREGGKALVCRWGGGRGGAGSGAGSASGGKGSGAGTGKGSGSGH